MSFRTFFLLAGLLLVAAVSSACAKADEAATASGDSTATSATATSAPEIEPRPLINKARAIIEPLGESGLSGTITFAPTDLGMQITYALSGLPVGVHGIHVHENDSCAEGPDGTLGGSAGGHFNPDDSPHGAPNLAASERHAGDLGNLHSLSAAPAIGSFNDSIATLDGEHNIVGKALIIHADEDDFVTQPTGNAGTRIGCGVIAAIEE